MTEHTPITALNTEESPRETALARAYPSMLASLTAFVIAERDLEDVGYSLDPAYAAWIRDAELAMERLTTTLGKINALRVEVPEDRPLRRMSLLVDAMLGHEAAGGARALHFEMQVAFFSKFQVAGIGPTAMHRNSLLIRARHLVTALSALPLFDHMTDADLEKPTNAYEEVGIF